MSQEIDFVEENGVLVRRSMRYSARRRPVREYVDDGELEIITEQGYMPTKMQIERFKQAGIVLQDFKRSLWDQSGEEE